MVLPVVPLLSGPWSQRCSRQSHASFAVTQPHGSERPSDVTEVDATTAGWESQNPWALVRVCLSRSMPPRKLGNPRILGPWSEFLD